MKTRQKTNVRSLSLTSLVSLTALMTLMTIGNLQAQVRIGEDATPVKGAVLDLSSSASGYVGGLKLPNVELTSLTAIPSTFKESVTTPTEKTDLTGTIVYNTYTNSSADIFPGVHQWDGTKWVLLSSATFTEVDGVIGNEVTNTTDQTLVRSGSGTAIDPYTLARAAIAGGDVTIPAGSNSATVVGLQGNSVSTTAPNTGQVLKWNGSAWAPAADNTGGGNNFQMGNGDVEITANEYIADKEDTFLFFNYKGGTTPSTICYLPEDAENGHFIWIANDGTNAVVFDPMPYNIVWPMVGSGLTAGLLKTPIGWVFVTGY